MTVTPLPPGELADIKLNSIAEHIDYNTHLHHGHSTIIGCSEKNIYAIRSNGQCIELSRAYRSKKAPRMKKTFHGKNKIFGVKHNGEIAEIEIFAAQDQYYYDPKTISAGALIEKGVQVEDISPIDYVNLVTYSNGELTLESSTPGVLEDVIYAMNIEQDAEKLVKFNNCYYFKLSEATVPGSNGEVIADIKEGLPGRYYFFFKDSNEVALMSPEGHYTYIELEHKVKKIAARRSLFVVLCENGDLFEAYPLSGLIGVAKGTVRDVYISGSHLFLIESNGKFRMLPEYDLASDLRPSKERQVYESNLGILNYSPEEIRNVYIASKQRAEGMRAIVNTVYDDVVYFIGRG